MVSEEYFMLCSADAAGKEVMVLSISSSIMKLH